MKILREGGMTTPLVIFWRFAPGVPLAYWLVRRRTVGLSLARPWIVAMRCAFGLGAAMGSFYAVRALSLVQHSTLHLLQPVFVAVLAPLFLSERLHRYATLALIVALAGSVAVIEPTAASLEAQWVPVTAAVAAALCSAGAHMSVRRATLTDRAEVLVLYFGAVATAWGLGWALLTDRFFAVPSDLTSLVAIGCIAGMAAFGLVGQYLMTFAYARGQAPVVAMVAYSAIPLGYALDLALWGRTATASALLGGATMVLAGAVLYRSQRRAPAI